MTVVLQFIKYQCFNKKRQESQYKNCILPFLYMEPRRFIYLFLGGGVYFYTFNHKLGKYPSLQNNCSWGGVGSDLGWISVF